MFILYRNTNELIFFYKSIAKSALLYLQDQLIFNNNKKYIYKKKAEKFPKIINYLRNTILYALKFKQRNTNGEKSSAVSSMTAVVRSPL